MKKQLDDYIEYLYREEKNAFKIAQSRIDFRAGFEAGQSKWVDIETPPNNERMVLVKIKDFRIPQENITEVSLGYYDEYKDWRYQHNDTLINSGHGWFLEQWMEIP